MPSCLAITGRVQALPQDLHCWNEWRGDFVFGDGCIGGNEARISALEGGGTRGVLFNQALIVSSTILVSCAEVPFRGRNQFSRGEGRALDDGSCSCWKDVNVGVL